MGPFLGQSNLIPEALEVMQVCDLTLLACLLGAKVEKYSFQMLSSLILSTTLRGKCCVPQLENKA